MTHISAAPRHGLGLRPVPMYVVGFAFKMDSVRNPRVILIEKQRPEWQRGLYNGPGGKLKAFEKSDAAMRREFNEETGLSVKDWVKFAQLKGPDFFVTFYSTNLTPEKFDAAKTTTDEQLVDVRVTDIWHLPVVPNLRVMIPLALDESGIQKPVLFYDRVPASKPGG